MTKRIFMVALVLTGLLSVIFGKMAYTQLWQGPIYAAQSFSGRTTTFSLEEIPRGNILDRYGENLLGGNEEPALIVFPDLLEQPIPLLEKIHEQIPLMQISAQQILPNYDPVTGKKIYPKPFAVTCTDAKSMQIISGWHENGLVIAPYQRRYGSTPLALHLIGCLDSEYNGTKGIEKRYNALLKGRHAEQYLATITDAKNNVLAGVGLRLVEQTDAIRSDIRLTIDKSMQQSMENILDQQHIVKGAAVILDTTTGQILAAASRPVFDPNNLTKTYGFSDNQLERVMGDDYTYYPGSSFKLITALAALEEKQASADTTFLCDNQPPYNKCPREHNNVTFKEALKVSCNNYFIRLGQQLGQTNLEYYMIEQLGFQIEKDKTLNSFAARANGVIGQEMFKVSPLQMANLSMMIANDGLFQPIIDPWKSRLIFQIISAKETTEQTVHTPGTQVFSADAVNQLQAMLAISYQTADGRVLSYAGKTGTPEIYSKQIGKHYLAWFTGYAPAEQPRYAVAIVIEEIAGIPPADLAGGKHALPIFKHILEAISP